MSPDHLNLAAILVCAAYIFAFDHLGRGRHIISAVLLALSAAAAVLLSVYIHRQAAEPAIVAGILLLLHCLWELAKWLFIESRFQARSRKRAKLPARRHKKASTTCPLTHDNIIDNFRRLAQVDDLAVAKPSIRFFAWNNKEDYIIQIYLTNEAWISLFWTPTDFELRDKEVKAACKAAGIPCRRHLLGMRAQGIATCRRGEVTITPADQLIHFDEFLHTVLAPQEEFNTWLADIRKPPAR